MNSGQCVILAGGLGTRMAALAKNTPKSLLPAHNRPFLHYQLSALAKQGIKNVVLCVGYGSDQIERYAEDGRTWNLTIRYVREVGPLRGTGGALRLAYDEGVLDSTFFVMYGDSFLPTDFSPVWTFFESRTEPALMVVTRNEGRWDRSNALFDGQKVTRYDKKMPTPEMTYIDYGLAILRASAVDQGIPPKNPYDLADLYAKLSERGKLAGFEVKTRFYEIGSPQGLLDFEAYLSESDH